MTRGPKVSTARGRRAGGREVRAWVSAEEYAAIERAAGGEVSAFVRGAVLRAAAVGEA